MKPTPALRYIDLVDIPALQALLEDFHQAIGLANAILDIDGNILAYAGWQDACTKFHRANPQTCQRCTQSDTSLATSMMQGMPYAIYSCKNGLADAVAPIIVNGQHIANVFSGQFFTEPPDMEFFRQQAQQFGFDQKKYLQAIAQVPIVQAERAEKVTRLYARLAVLLADNSLNSLKQQQTTEELKSINAELESRVKARTKALSESEARMRAILDASPVPMALNDKGQHIRYINPAFFKTFGYQLDDIPMLADWWPQAYPDVAYRKWVVNEWQKRLETAKKNGTPFDPLELNIRCKNGSERIVLAQATRAINESSETHLIVFYDITERKNVELALLQSEQRFRNMFENMSSGIGYG